MLYQDLNTSSVISGKFSVCDAQGIMELGICFDERNSHDSLQVRLYTHNLLEPRLVNASSCKKINLFTQAIFAAATRCNFCRAKVATSKSHV